MQFGRDGLVVVNYLAKRSSPIGPLGTALLAGLDDWQSSQAVLARFAPAAHAALLSEIARLSTAAVIVERHTPAGEADEAFEREFVWGAEAAFYHFSIRNTEYMTPGQFAGWMAEHVASTPPVPLHFGHVQAPGVVSLPVPTGELEGMALMRRRRSFRGFSDQPIDLVDLGDCLFAGLGITGFVRGSFDEGYLPLSMTPSGGGRNPYEAYVYARRVGGLAPGTYHYSAVDHSLCPVSNDHQPAPGAVLGGQPWFDNAAALVLLVADFQRTMWKYPHPTGYRVVVLEAGHIAQNIILAATAHGLTATPTCAVSDCEAEKLTRSTALTRTTMYAVALGHRSRIPTAVDPIHVVANRALSGTRSRR
jgi:SagB-type dehydrogenase family enzyme